MSLIIAIASLIYGLFALFGSNLLKKDLKGIDEKHKKRYAKLAGAALLLESAVLFAIYYLSETGRLYTIVRQPVQLILLLILGFLPAVIYILSRKILSKK